LLLAEVHALGFPVVPSTVGSGAHGKAVAGGLCMHCWAAARRGGTELETLFLYRSYRNCLKRYVVRTLFGQ